jgi:hypothetical protein
MKKQVLRALVVTCALNVNGNAQNESNFKDTLVINPNADAKVLFIGIDLEEMAIYNRADSLKDFFLADLEKARQQPSFPADSRITHYFVHPNGKRRLKAESTDYQEPALDVAKEIRSMGLNLPAYAYIIHDAVKNCELQIYLSGPEKISELRNLNITEAIQSIAKDKKAQRKFFRIDIMSQDGQWKRKTAINKKVKSFEIHTQIGAGIIGSQLTPDLGIEFAYAFSNKYSIPQLRIGGTWRFNMLTSYANHEFNDFYNITSYNLSLLANVGQGKVSSIKWAGLEFGYLVANGGFLNNNYKLGVVYAFDAIQVELDFYNSKLNFFNANKSSFNANKNILLYGFTVRTQF